MRLGGLLPVCVFAVVVHAACAYKHVIFMHGILSGPGEALQLHNYIQEVHPGTNVTSIDAFNDLYSLEPMWNQVYKIQIQVQEIIDANPGGVHLVCYSQGGLLCRGLLSVLHHNVHSVICLSSPLAGQFGDTEYLKFLFPNYLKENIFKYFYTDKGQKWSIANYWNDPHQQELYKKWATYLPILNNETNNAQSVEFRENFLRIKTLVLIGGPDDGVITPWQSSQFGMYDTSEHVVAMKDAKWYKDDSFGLLTLDKRKAIHVFTKPGIQHLHWYRNKDIFNCCVEPYLT